MGDVINRACAYTAPPSSPDLGFSLKKTFRLFHMHLFWSLCLRAWARAHMGLRPILYISHYSIHVPIFGLEVLLRGFECFL